MGQGASADGLAEIRVRVARIVVEALELDIPPKSIPLDEPLFDGALGIDSVGMLNIVVGIEEEFDIAISPDDLTLELLFTLDSLCEYVNERTGLQGPQSVSHDPDADTP